MSTTNSAVSDFLTTNISDGIALLTIHQKNAPTNLFSFEFIEHYLATAKELLAHSEVQGLIVTAQGRDFLAGADLREFLPPPADKGALFQRIIQVHQAFRALEQGGKPIVAAINGNALGGGYELALTCHYRIALSSNKLRIGLPEVKLGLLPGGGGTQRLTHLLGVPQAIEHILQGKLLSPKQAFHVGMVDAIVDDAQALIPVAKQWILEKGEAIQPWDDRRYKMPQGGVLSPIGAITMTGAIGNLRKTTHGNYPSAQYALSCIHDGTVLPIDRGLEVEARYFLKALYSKEAQNIIRTSFFAINAAKKQGSAANVPPIKTVGILGAGMMGAGIAYVSAKAGLQVQLQDVTQEDAQRGKQHSQELLQKALLKKRQTPEKIATILARIQATDTVNNMQDCDLIIEAIPEDPSLKAKVLSQVEGALKAGALMASNTSTLPITGLAKATQTPSRFIGLHFFSPVHKMPLVEIIMGEQTSEAAKEAALAYVQQIGKVPIVINDKRGFFTSRVFATFTREGGLLLSEGVAPTLIENIAKRVGMPVGPLAVLDEISLSLAIKILNTTKEEHNSATQAFLTVLEKMVLEQGRAGKKAGQGFYTYPKEGKKHLWKELTQHFPTKEEQLSADVVGKRLLHIMALESYRCLEEDVLLSPTDGDVGSLLGFGFPAYTGGVFSYIDYVGLRQFVSDCDAFAARFGVRFEVPASLRNRAKTEERFHQA
ncbi:MAG: 3-hydroxyacyl-CoA dehydrogenase NAD-binding domain-containing protein [Aureispira sp.]